MLAAAPAKDDADADGFADSPFVLSVCLHLLFRHASNHSLDLFHFDLSVDS